jgi:hypothetical protein
MKLILLLFAVIFLSDDSFRLIEYNGSSVKTIFEVDEKFYGIYKGRKKGYLQLNQDGSGVYNYDVYGFAPVSCEKKPIQLEWGFLVKDEDHIVSFKREYGQSYPILLKSVSDIKFQGCQTEVLLDFIMEYKDGKMGVSSSDDWIKE